MNNHVLEGFELYEYIFDIFVDDSSDNKKRVSYYDQAVKRRFVFDDFGHYYVVNRVDVEGQLEYLLNNGVAYSNGDRGGARNAKKVEYVEKKSYREVSPFYVRRETFEDKLMKPFSILFDISLDENIYLIPVEIKKRIWESSSGNRPTQNIKMIDGHTKIERNKIKREGNKILLPEG